MGKACIAYQKNGEKLKKCKKIIKNSELYCTNVTMSTVSMMCYTTIDDMGRKEEIRC